MEHNPISMGDIANAGAERNRSDILYLESRVAELEARYQEIVDWSQGVAAAINLLEERLNNDIHHH